MARPRRVRATFSGASPGEDAGDIGLQLVFRVDQRGFEVDQIEDFAVLGPEHCVNAVAGIGKVLRILRAARVAAPDDSHALLNRVDLASNLLERATETPCVLELRPRSRLRMLVWKEDDVEVIENVTEVIETPDSYVVRRERGMLPVVLARPDVVRRRVETHRWFEILAIERA